MWWRRTVKTPVLTHGGLPEDQEVLSGLRPSWSPRRSRRSRRSWRAACRPPRRELTLGAGGAGELGGLVEQLVQLRVLLEVRRLEVVGPQHPEVVLDQLGALLLDQDGAGAEVGVVVVGDLLDDRLDRLGLDAGLRGVVDAARQVAVGLRRRWSGRRVARTCEHPLLVWVRSVHVRHYSEPRDRQGFRGCGIGLAVVRGAVRCSPPCATATGCWSGTAPARAPGALVVVRLPGRRARRSSAPYDGTPTGAGGSSATTRRGRRLVARRARVPARRTVARVVRPAAARPRPRRPTRRR